MEELLTISHQDSIHTTTFSLENDVFKSKKSLSTSHFGFVSVLILVQTNTPKNTSPDHTQTLGLRKQFAVGVSIVADCSNNSFPSYACKTLYHCRRLNLNSQQFLAKTTVIYSE
mgnify:CR=1 FL=1